MTDHPITYADAAAQQATLDILGLISRSRHDPQPVFDAILDHAMRLCDTSHSWLFLYSEPRAQFDMVAHAGTPDTIVAAFRDDPVKMSDTASDFVKAATTLRPVHTPDARDTDRYRQGGTLRQRAVDELGTRTMLQVPLVQEGHYIGVIALFRKDVRPFSKDQITLAETFAAQAVIAIENVRQFREVQERLERERASREILGVISQSRDDETPVFDKILQNALRLCEADMAVVNTANEARTEVGYAAGINSTGPTFKPGRNSWPIDSQQFVCRAILENRTFHTVDLKDTDLYRSGDPTRRNLVDNEGMRTQLVLPLRQGDRAIACFSLYRRDVRPFSEAEIALLETFAAQAVIAIENVHQFREVQTRLERERASREILQIISTSRADPTPVFDVILKNAAQLSGAPLANLCLLDDARSQWTLMAHHGDGLRHLSVGKTTQLEDSNLVPAISMRTASIVHIENLLETDLYRQGDAGRHAMVHEEGMRTILGVPLLLGDRAIGCITLFRREVKAFTADEIALVETFAAQAVIAITNVRQFLELQERLERETATGEVLQVISRSRDDDLPVFETILANAARLCGAVRARLMLVNDDRTKLRAAGAWGEPNPAMPDGAVIDMVPEMAPVRSILEKRVINEKDGRETEGYKKGIPQIVANIDAMQARSVLAVPLIQGDEAIGCIVLTDREVAAYDDNDASLVQTFAAQAVIAIENVRQFREVQERLERETATKNILSVISRSRDDEQPVFDTILENARTLCDATMGAFVMGHQGGGPQVVVAHLGVSAATLDLYRNGRFEMDPDTSIAARAIIERRILHVEDMKDTDRYRAGDPRVRSLVDEQGIRTNLFVPLISKNTGIGCLILFRKTPTPFTQEQIDLVETFAAQAVIAIENVRQFREVQERLERERASADVLEIVSRSRDDEFPVFDAVLRHAAILCDAETSALMLGRPDQPELRLAAYHAGDRKQTEEETTLLDGIRQSVMEMNPDQHISAEAICSGEVTHVEDLTQDPRYLAGEPGIVSMVDIQHERTILSVPLQSNDGIIGAFNLHRKRVAPFTPDEIELVRNFASQAVIAIENVRQFREVQERLEREKASGDVLEIISRSRDDDLPVFRTITEAVARLCNAPLAYICVLNSERTHVTIPAHVGATPDFGARLDRFNEPVESHWLFAVESTIERKVIRIDDLSQTDLYRDGNEYRIKMVDEEGMRSVLVVPLISGPDGVGCIVLYRREVAPFSDAELDLVRSFAAQAVIAIENVRQFREVQERLERETATGEVLEVISRSRSDDLPVFDVILENAARLCNASNANLTLVNEARDAVRLVASQGRQILSLVVGESEWKLDEAMSVAEALASGQPIHIPDYAATRSYLDGSNKLRVRLVDEDGVHASLAVPLMGTEGPIGTLMLHRDAPGAFSEAEISLVTSFAAQAVIAIENVKTFNALETLNAELGDRVEAQVGEIERMGRLKRFLSPAVADAVVSAGNDKLLSSHRALISVLFADIRGFTAFCESAEPEETIEVLQTYHEQMGQLIAEHGAGVDTRSGDGIMVIFNDPLPCDDPAGDALKLAFAMRERMADLCTGWRRLGHRLGFGVGMALGYATVGMVGSAGRYEYTASGTAVNLASRLSDVAGDGDILLAPRAFAALEDRIESEVVGDIEFKGLRAPIEVVRAVRFIE